MASKPLPQLPGCEPQPDSALISRIAEARVVTLTAPAGFGKTTALRRWAGALAAQGSAVHFLSAGTAAQAVLSKLASANAGATLIIDDAHLLQPNAADALAALVSHPDGARVILA